MKNAKNRIRFSRWGFQILALVFVISIAVQTFLAGLAIFTDSSYWLSHTTFVVWFQFIPIVMLILSVTGRLPKPARWQSAALFLLIVPLQYMSIHIPGAGAIHPVIALALFGLAINVWNKAGKYRIED